MAQRGTLAKIDLVELEKLCAMQATDAEIGAFFNVAERTILRRKKVKRFAEVMERGRAKGRLSMRRLQLKLLEGGNSTMAVWLGKQYLGQTDQVSHQLNETPFFYLVPRAGPLPEMAPEFEPERQLLPAADDADTSQI